MKTLPPKTQSRTKPNWHAHNREGVGGWVVAPLHPSGDGSHYAPITQRITEEDARLISASHELLEACKIMVQCIREEKNPFVSGWGEDEETVRVTDTIKMEEAFNAARAAIAKAE